MTSGTAGSFTTLVGAVSTTIGATEAVAVARRP
eukprot:CAMPEP_0169171144 /NCGR_PEP_ID=MMETSP1015-20121227/62543_1 /TAXON_ID=342587 /ORGANISM="Karlodinium micrum, Strain CCMP2283" /LENGTH=32 /DNA_ID= /DNA_START= /DNA_END= /DNA_ORIENTATION=